MAESLTTTGLRKWVDRFWLDLQPTPGRLNGSLRIVLSTVITLILLMTLRMPSASLGLYFIFLVGRDSPAVSLRSGLFTIGALAFTVATVLTVVALSDNNPMARLLSVSVVVFLAGMLMLSTNLTVLASTWGLIYCTLIAFWETHAPADFLVKQSLYLIGTIAIAVLCSVAVEYCFGARDPAAELQKQRTIRYEALSKMFSLYAQGASREQIVSAVSSVSRLAVSGQNGMLQLYNIIVDRKLDPGALPIGTRVRITMLAQLMDVSAAFGTQNLTVTDPELQRRCGHIAALCLDLIHDIRPTPEELEEQKFTGSINLLDRVDENLHAILSMPAEIAGGGTKNWSRCLRTKFPSLFPGPSAEKRLSPSH